MSCPLCTPRRSHVGITIVPYPPSKEGGAFGLGTAKDGDICCSFYEGCYSSFEEANEAAQDVSLHEVLEEQGYDPEYDDSDHGPADSDPYDRDGPQW